MTHWCWPQFVITHETCSTCSTKSQIRKDGIIQTSLVVAINRLKGPAFHPCWWKSPINIFWSPLMRSINPLTYHLSNKSHWHQISPSLCSKIWQRALKFDKQPGGNLFGSNVSKLIDKVKFQGILAILAHNLIDQGPHAVLWGALPLRK